MSRVISFVMILFLFTAFSAFAEYDAGPDVKIPVFKPVTYYGNEAVVPYSIANNEFYIESVRLNKLAIEVYDLGDYDASAGFAQEAIRFAQLSDEFVADQLIIEAKRLLDWADKNNIQTRFPNNYNEGKEQYETAVAAHAEEEWNNSIIAAINAIEIFAAFESTGRPGTTVVRPTTTTDSAGKARQYTVRTWRVEKDCLWTIAGYPWVYGDPWKWRVLYDANKSRLPDPNNPDLIEPGMVLEIPDLQGEARQGMWRP